MRWWVIALATLCCSVSGQEDKVPVKYDIYQTVFGEEDKVLEKDDIHQTSNYPQFLSHQGEDVVVRTRLGRLVGSKGQTTNGVEYARFSKSAINAPPCLLILCLLLHTYILHKCSPSFYPSSSHQGSFCSASYGQAPSQGSSAQKRFDYTHWQFVIGI